MINELQPIKSLLLSPEIEIDGNDKEKFYRYFEKTLNAAHRRSKGDWSLQIEEADWIKNGKAMVYDFYEAKNNQPIFSVVYEEREDAIWLEVLK